MMDIFFPTGAKRECSDHFFSLFYNLNHFLYFAVKKMSDGTDNVATGDAAERFAPREAQKLRFLRE